MAAQRDGRVLGLRQIFPSRDSPDDTTLDIIAIHGLGTESPRTWEFKKDASGVVNWLSDEHMLPAAIPEARIFTYDWDANYFEDAPVQTLLGHADVLLALLAESRIFKRRPIIFIASCFGGIVLAEALNRAAQEGSVYGRMLLSTVGVIFLATPFLGTGANQQAQWQVVVGGIMGEQTSNKLVQDLNSKTGVLQHLTKIFAENANHSLIRLPIICFHETKKTEMLRRILSPKWAAMLSSGYTHKILVEESSACLQGFPSRGLAATHAGMNKFDSPENANFKLVKGEIRRLVDGASSVLKHRESSIQEYHWIVPFGRNQDFVGRESSLKELIERLHPEADEDDCQRIAIVGLGGVGKSQIALETAFQIRKKYPNLSVFWVPAIDTTSFERAYREIGRKLKVPGIEEDQADVKSLVKAALSQENAERWLLIIDNADDLELLCGGNGERGEHISSTALTSYFPFSRKGAILFTTRSREAAVELAGKNIITIDVMGELESLKLLEASLVEKTLSQDIESTSQLLSLLANLPLAIKQVAAFLNKNQISTAEYLEVFKSNDDDLIYLLSKDFDDHGRYKDLKNPIATTWLISFRQILSRDSLAADYLRFMSCLSPQDIPQSLLPLATKSREKEAIGTLKAYSFITQREGRDSYAIHRLVQLAARNWLKQLGQLNLWATKTLELMSMKFPSPAHENRDKWIEYLPHAQFILNSHKHLVEEGEPKGKLLSNVGESFYFLGKDKEAEPYFRELLQLNEKLLGKEHADTLASMNNLAEVLREQGKFEEAEAMNLKALQLREKVLGKEHPDTLTSMNNLAQTLSSQGKHKEAEAMNLKALQLHEKVLGKEHPNTLTYMSNLSYVLSKQDKHKEAEAMHREALQLREKVLGKEHPDTLTSMNNLAQTLSRAGKYREAELMNRNVLQRYENLLGKEHPNTLTNLNNLGHVLSKQGKLKEAEAIHREALQLREKVLGKEHLHTINNMNDLAEVLRKQDKQEAEPIHREALQLRENVLGKEHPDTISSMNNLALTLCRQGNLEEGFQIYQEAIKLAEKVLGKEHPTTRTIVENLAVSKGNTEYQQDRTDMSSRNDG